MLPSCYGTLAEAIPTTIRPEFNLGSLLLIYLFYMHATIQQKCMVFFHLIFLFCSTIRPKIRVLIDLFVLCARDHSTEIYDPLSFILPFEDDHSTKN